MKLVAPDDESGLTLIQKAGRKTAREWYRKIYVRYLNSFYARGKRFKNMTEV
jgi:hypothetical protein